MSFKYFNLHLTNPCLDSLLLIFTEEKENSISTQITMPPRMLKRGRPKGAGSTVIGLPKKRKTTSAIPFLKKSSTEKERGKWKVLMYM